MHPRAQIFCASRGEIGKRYARSEVFRFEQRPHERRAMELHLVESFSTSILPTRAQRPDLLCVRSRLSLLAVRVTRAGPKIGMAGLVSPANFRKREFLPLSGPTAGRSDEVVMLPAGS